MNLDDILKAAPTNKRRKRKGRGTGSGRGKTCGRGHKGWGSRSGNKSLLGYEGGTNPLLARIPKRGFSNAAFRKTTQIVNVSDLERFEDGKTVDAAALAEAGLIQDAAKPVKILGNGNLTKKLSVVASTFSTAAQEKISAAGGSAERV